MTTDDAMTLLGHISAILWSFPAMAAIGGVKYIRDMARSMAELNTHIATICTRVDGHEASLKDHEYRLRNGRL